MITSTLNFFFEPSKSVKTLGRAFRMLRAALLCLTLITSCLCGQFSVNIPQLSEPPFSVLNARLRFGANISLGGVVSPLPVVHSRVAFAVSPAGVGSNWSVLGVDVEDVVTQYGRPQQAAAGLAVRNACSATPGQGCQFWNVFGSSDVNLPVAADLLSTGITISFWMKADWTTSGDVFFIADNDLTNASATVWKNAFHDSSSALYQSAYSSLSLSSGILTWRTVDSVTGESSTATFTDRSLVDGKWHLVNLIVGQTVLKTRIARWYIDGRGSFRAPSYQCVSGSNYQWLRAPDASAMLQAARSFTARHPAAASVTAQTIPFGVLGFGLWNGSLFSVQMFPYDLTHMQVLQTFGERWMMDQLPISATFALSYAIALGLAFLAILPIAAAQVRNDIVSQVSKISNAISQDDSIASWRHGRG